MVPHLFGDEHDLFNKVTISDGVFEISHGTGFKQFILLLQGVQLLSGLIFQFFGRTDEDPIHVELGLKLINLPLVLLKHGEGGLGVVSPLIKVLLALGLQSLCSLRDLLYKGLRRVIYVLGLYFIVMLELGEVSLDDPFEFTQGLLAFLYCVFYNLSENKWSRWNDIMTEMCTQEALGASVCAVLFAVEFNLLLGMGGAEPFIRAPLTLALLRLKDVQECKIPS